MKHKHIERYIRLRQALTQKEWEALNSLYDYQLHEKERQLTENISLDDSEVKVFRSHAQKLLEIDEQAEKKSEVTKTPLGRGKGILVTTSY